MANQLDNLRKDLKAFTVKANSMSGGNITLTPTDGTTRRTGDMNDTLKLAFTIRQTGNHLKRQSQKKHDDFFAELSPGLLADTEKKRAAKMSEIVDLARTLITRLRSAALIADWDGADAVDKIGILADLAKAAAALDLYDPRDPILGNNASSQTDRYLSDVQMGRPSILDPTKMLDLQKKLPITHDTDGNPQVTDKQSIKLGIASSGSDTEADFLKWITVAQAQTAGLMIVATFARSRQADAADALLAAYVKMMPGIDKLEEVLRATTSTQKLREISNAIEKIGLSNVPPNGGQDYKGIDLAGVPLGLLDGFLKTISAINAFNKAANPTAALVAFAQSMGELTKTMASAVAAFTTGAVKKLATKAVAIITLPMLCFELAATHRGVSSAMRSGDASVAFGHALLGIATVGSAVLGIYIAFSVAAAAGGPPGLVVAAATGIIVAITLAGLYLVQFTKNSDLEKFAAQCAYGKKMSDWTKENPSSIAYEFGTPAKMDCAKMLERLNSINAKIGFSATVPERREHIICSNIRALTRTAQHQPYPAM